MKFLQAVLGLVMLVASVATAISFFKLAGFWIGLFMLGALVVGLSGR